MVRALVAVAVVAAGCGEVSAEGVVGMTGAGGGAGGAPLADAGSGTGGRSGIGGAIVTLGTGGTAPVYPACVLSNGQPFTKPSGGAECDKQLPNGSYAYKVSPDGYRCTICQDAAYQITNVPCYSPENKPGVPPPPGTQGYLCVLNCTACN